MPEKKRTRKKDEDGKQEVSHSHSKAMREKTEKKEVEKKDNQSKEEVTEIFEVEKDGKEQIVETHSVQEEKPASREQIKKETKLFRNVVIVMVGFALMFFAVYMIINSMRHFEVQGVRFEIVKEGQLTLYKTSLPVTYQEPGTGMAVNADYNFFLRNDPRTLEDKVPIVGNITFRKNIVMDVTTEELYCEGDWPIGLVNTQNLYNVLGINILVKNESAEYEPFTDYMFVTINEGNQTEIRQVSGNTYEMNVANCEVLPAFERLMLETFIRNKELNK